MRMVSRGVYWIAAMAVVSGTFWLGLAHRPVESSPDVRPVPVEVEPVATSAIEQTLELTGMIAANQRVEVASKVAGRIESLSVTMQDGNRQAVDVGLSVTQGQPLAVIDHDMHLAQVAAAEAEVKARQVQLAEARRESQRIIGLFESGSVTEQARDQAITASELAAAGLSLARANLELAQVSLRESTIISPLNGVVTARYIDEGNLVAQGQRIVSLADIKMVRLLVAAPERYSSQVCQGMPVKIAVDAFAERVFEANVYCVYPTLDEQTHTLRVEIRLANDDLSLRPGMFAHVKLVLGHRDEAVVVARDVVLGGKIDAPYVYVAEGGRARKRIVEIGLTDGPHCEITDGLQPGESLIVNGMHRLADDSAVEIVRLEDIQ
ncbi:MAG: efflux RND transporter periplasmic adaptor subunit [Sedimentisphaerales bacterium]|nr:efflux RND transporter periplasmic adaptor subunit [Sedimentisphaerales bacterium]